LSTVTTISVVLFHTFLTDVVSGVLNSCSCLLLLLHVWYLHQHTYSVGVACVSVADIKPSVYERDWGTEEWIEE